MEKKRCWSCGKPCYGRQCRNCYVRGFSAGKVSRQFNRKNKKWRR